LDRDHKVPEGGSGTLSHGEKVTKGVLFPIVGEIVGTKINHKHIKREGNQTVVLSTDLVAHMAVKNASDDE
jgi:hypothetical protein